MLESLYIKSGIQLPLDDFANWEYYHVAKLFSYDPEIAKNIKLLEISGAELLKYTKEDIRDKFKLSASSLIIFNNLHTLLVKSISARASHAPPVRAAGPDSGRVPKAEVQPDGKNSEATLKSGNSSRALSPRSRVGASDKGDKKDKKEEGVGNLGSPRKSKNPKKTDKETIGLSPAGNPPSRCASIVSDGEAKEKGSAAKSKEGASRLNSPVKVSGKDKKKTHSQETEREIKFPQGTQIVENIFTESDSLRPSAHLSFGTEEELVETFREHDGTPVQSYPDFGRALYKSVEGSGNLSSNSAERSTRKRSLSVDKIKTPTPTKSTTSSKSPALTKSITPTRKLASEKILDKATQRSAHGPVQASTQQEKIPRPPAPSLKKVEVKEGNKAKGSRKEREEKARSVEQKQVKPKSPSKSVETVKRPVSKESADKPSRAASFSLPSISYTGPREKNIIHDIQLSSVSYKRGSKYFDFILWPTSECVITHLIVSKLQTRPTLKILYSLANNSYILTPDYVYDTAKKRSWGLEEEYEHSNWPKLKERKRVKLPLKNSKFYLLSNLKKLTIMDATSLIEKLGGKLVNSLDEATYVLSDSTSSSQSDKTAISKKKVISEVDFINTISTWNTKEFNSLLKLTNKTTSKKNDTKVKKEKNDAKRHKGASEDGLTSTLANFDTPLYSDDDAEDYINDSMF